MTLNIRPVTKLIAILIVLVSAAVPEDDTRFLNYVVDPRSADIRFFWKDDQGQIFRSIQNVKAAVEKNDKQLMFAMNGGMYKVDNSPQGLFIENSLYKSQLDTTSGAGNFYLKPNGIFYLTHDNSAGVCTTGEFKDNGQVKFATQSGPMLLIDGNLHPAFKQGSANLNIRNGVGILPDGKIIFAMSRQPVNFYDFATFFKNMNCKNALYLDGFVSRTYLPEKGSEQLDGNFGVIIGVVK